MWVLCIQCSYLFPSYHAKMLETFNSVQLLSHVRLFATPSTAACQASLSITDSWSSLRLISIESVTSPKHLILCRPLVLPPSIFPSIRVFSNESAFHIRWPKYWSFSFCISPSNEYSGLISFRMDWFNPSNSMSHQILLIYFLFLQNIYFFLFSSADAVFQSLVISP